MHCVTPHEAFPAVSSLKSMSRVSLSLFSVCETGTRASRVGCCTYVKLKINVLSSLLSWQVMHRLPCTRAYFWSGICTVACRKFNLCFWYRSYKVCWWYGLVFAVSVESPITDTIGRLEKRVLLSAIVLDLWLCKAINKIKCNRFHNRYDVVGGALLGGTFSVCTCFILSRKFAGSQSEAVTQSKSSSTNNNRCGGEQRLLPTPMIIKEEFTMNNLE